MRVRVPGARSYTANIMFTYLRYLTLAFALSGCDMADAPKPQIQRASFKVVVKEGVLPPNVHGTATYFEHLNVCVITLREYPVCLLHEIRHCVEGLWHDESPNAEDC